jgi:serine/threonine-protein kinase
MADESSRCCGACEATLSPGSRFCGACGRDNEPESAFSPTERVAPTPPSEPGAPSPPLPPMRLLPGTMLSVYRIESVLGEGGMGVVYRAHDEARGRPVALKCLHTNLAGDQEIRRRFAREARVLRAQSHPNIVAVYDFVEHESLLAIVMEIVEGQTLVQHVARWRARVPFTEILVVFRGVLDAVAEGHRHGVIHRDLKPDNILVTGGGGEALRPKLVDFGIAKILQGTTYTVTGALLGTCAYMSPEQVQQPRSADPRSDIYSLGITLYQFVTGKLPFDGDNHFAIMMAHVNEAPRPPTELRPDIPPLLERLILDCLSKDPAGRPASCEAFRIRLDEALAGYLSTRPPAAPGSLPAVLKGQGGEEMVLVPGGPFLMGKSRRSVEIDAFYMDRMPVTNREYLAFVDVTGYRPTDPGASRFISHLRSGKIPRGQDDHPVVYVSWLDARAYAMWAGKRLPTEAEWEKAARGTDGRKYPWGRSEPGAKKANYGRKDGGPGRVGSFPEGASPYGILDLAGNVWEWCDDHDAPSFYENGPSHNPRNEQPGERALLVMRGGSYMFGPRSLRTYARTSFEAEVRFAGGGFRCVRSAG